MTSNISVPEPTPGVSTVPRIASQSPEVSERTTYKQLRRQLAFAPPSKQKELLYEHLRRAAEALQRPISSHLLEAITSLDNSKILGMSFSAKKLDDWLRQRATDELFPEQDKATPCQVVRPHGNHITSVGQVLGHGPEVVTVPSTEKGKSKGRPKVKNRRVSPPNWQTLAPVTPEPENPVTPGRHGPGCVTGTTAGCQPSPVTPIGDPGTGPRVQHLSAQSTCRVAQNLQEAPLQLQTLGPEVSLLQEVGACVEQGIAEDNCISSPRTVSTTQSLGQTLGQGARVFLLAKQLLQV